SYACEVTLQPVERFPLDAAILFSDILTVPDAMGLGLSFVAGEGPKFAKTVRTEEDVAKLYVPDPADKLQYVMDAVSEIKKALKNRIPLIGFSGSPFTLACYMIEGGSSKGFHTVKKMMYQNPKLLHQILDINAQAVAKYLNAQIDSGVQAVMVFDTWGGTLANREYPEFSLKYMHKVLEDLTKKKDGEKIPSIVFTKGCAPWIKQIAKIGSDGIGLDWTVSLHKVRKTVKDKVALQGNLDPSVLFADEEAIRSQARAVIEDFGKVEDGGHIFNLGHGIEKETLPESVGYLVDEVHSYSRKFHK
ncbi:MAG: uroporphyrinogen decarboxylase, partial [Burkholderiales bacterium]|nr:uroporphyrinogen decarboxylase [Burkholderiales bacterium]